MSRGTKKTFEAAIEEMAATGAGTYGPMHFQDYLELHGMPKVRTAQYISVDSLVNLSLELREAGMMVFRLGCGVDGAKGTYFGLARCRAGWADFFLEDWRLLEMTTPQAYLPSVSARRLFAFQLLPKLTESSLVNLAVGSGLLHQALGLGEGYEQVVPATGQSTFSFDFRPHADIETIWQHNNGQVEVDALFVGRREGKESLFLVEAKAGQPSGTLAKHKLCYPLAALRADVPKYIDIVPVYLKTWRELDGQHFLVTECSSSVGEPLVISEFRPVKVHHMVLHGFGS